MPPQVATLLCAGFVLWLFAQERKGRARLSAAIWLPIAWLVVLGSRPVSNWIYGTDMDTVDEGGALDTLVYQFLEVAACVVLARRRVNWRAVFAANRWLIFYFLYLGLSVLWSDYSAIALKRWVKDVGSVLMVLVIFTEADPVQALKTTFLRCAYLLVPFSVLFIKYFPELGRAYDGWTFEVINVGVARNKNMLGMTLFFCALPLLWSLFDKLRERIAGPKWKPLIGHSLLCLMIVWLLRQAHSSTAAACTIVASGIFAATRVSYIRPKLGRATVLILVAAVLFVVVGPMLGLHETLISLLGRDLTFTGRTVIWEELLAEPINPLIGVGHYSFWMGERVERLSQPFSYLLNEAHNGYIEVYLNSGLIGLGLLLVVLVSCWRKNTKEALTGDSFAGFRLAVFGGTIVYGVTEVVFRFGLLSAALLAVLIAHRPAARALQPLVPVRFSSRTKRPTPPGAGLGIARSGF